MNRHYFCVQHDGVDEPVDCRTDDGGYGAFDYGAAAEQGFSYDKAGQADDYDAGNYSKGQKLFCGL